MKYYGTKNNKDYGFYLENFDNAIEITDEYWLELLDRQNKGKIIIITFKFFRFKCFTFY